MGYTNHQIGRLETAAVIEATTLVLLIFVAVPLKYMASLPLAVSFMGPIHGLAFVAYGLLVLRAARDQDWPNDIARRLLLKACIPFSGFTSPGYLRARLRDDRPFTYPE